MRHGTYGYAVRTALWYAYSVRAVAHQLPCASGTHGTQEAGARQHGGPGGGVHVSTACYAGPWQAQARRMRRG